MYLMSRALFETKRTSGQKLDIALRQEVILELRELMQNDDLSLNYIANHFGVSLNTASAWRKAAMVLIAKDDQGFSRDGLRHIQVGRINAQLSRLQADLNTVNDPVERGKIHDRIIKYYDTLHRITGLNSETVDHTHTLKPLEIRRATIETSTTSTVDETDIDIKA